MLEKLFQRDPIMEEKLHDQYGSLFQIFRNSDYKTSKASPSNALIFDSIFACINVLSDDVAKLPFKTYRKNVTTGEVKQVKDNDVHRLLRVKPNRYMTPFTFLKLIVTDLNIWGNSYTLIAFNKEGGIDELIPLTASVTRPVIDKKGDLYYQTNYKGKNITLYADEVLHIKGMSTDGITGIAPIESIRTQIESNEIASQYNYKTIESGGLPQGILTVTGVLEPEAKKRVREGWNKTNSGEGIAIVDGGMDYKQIGINHEQLQWLDAQKYNTQRIASIFKVPLHKINDLENATYTNIEHQSIDYVKNTLQPLITQIEQEFSYKLYTKEEAVDGYYVKFNMDSELRGDSESRAKVNQINFSNGFKTMNEVRGSNEDSPYPFDFADEPFVTLNYAPARNIEVLQNNNYGKHLQGGGDEPPISNEDDEGGDNDNAE